MFPSLLFFLCSKDHTNSFQIDYFAISKIPKSVYDNNERFALDKKRHKSNNNKKILFTIFNLQTLSDRIVLIVRRQMTVLAWQMTAKLWTEAVHSSWQIIHQKWKIALRSPCDNRRPFPMKWPIGGCNSTIMHKSDWEMVSEFIFFLD